MTEIRILENALSDTQSVVSALRNFHSLRTAEVISDDEKSIDLDGLTDLDTKATKTISDAGSDTAADVDLARELHQALQPIRNSAPWLLNEQRFWEWMAVIPFREYCLDRWCGGSVWLDDDSIEQPKDSRILRYVMKPGSVHSQSRHVIRRLYIYADCSIAYDNTYDHLDTIVGGDLDIPGAVFERKLGLSPTMAVVLCRTAGSILPTKKTSSSPTISARTKRRQFFSQVNLLASTVSLEYLSEPELTKYLDEIVKAIN
jgi:hypothetical protein